MSNEFLITLTYSTATFFMMFIFWGLGLVTMMRRIRFQSDEPLHTYQTKHPNQHYRLVHGPLDEWREWNKKRRDNTNRVDSNVVMPMRYQQPLFFGDPLSDTTKKSPVIDTDAKAS
jgi:hypothetical protein